MGRRRRSLFYLSISPRITLCEWDARVVNAVIRRVENNVSEAGSVDLGDRSEVVDGGEGDKEIFDG